MARPNSTGRDADANQFHNRRSRALQVRMGCSEATDNRTLLAVARRVGSSLYRTRRQEGPWPVISSPPLAISPTSGIYGCKALWQQAVSIVNGSVDYRTGSYMFLYFPVMAHQS